MEIEFRDSKAVLVDFAGEPAKVQRAGLRATNRALLAARTVIVRLMAKDTGLKAKDIRDRITVQNAVLRRPEARLATNLKRIPLTAFGASGPQPSRGKGRGVSWKALGGRKRDEHAFIARVQGPLPSGVISGGHIGVFVRAMNVDGRRVGRLPIKQLYGPSLGVVFRKFRPDGLRRAEEVFRTTFAHELAFRHSDAGEAIGAGTD